MATKRTFIAFIDEAGDEGFFIVPRPDKKSSEWFIMSAVVVPADKTIMFENALVAFRAIVSKHKSKSRNRDTGFHFRDARHHDRIAFLRALRGWPFTVITVATHKPSVRKDTSLSQEKHALFEYTATRPLLDLGNIRNSFAHRRDFKLTDDRIRSFYNCFDQIGRDIILSEYAKMQKGSVHPKELWDLSPKDQFILIASCLRAFLRAAHHRVMTARVAPEGSPSRHT